MGESNEAKERGEEQRGNKAGFKIGKSICRVSLWQRFGLVFGLVWFGLVGLVWTPGNTCRLWLLRLDAILGPVPAKVLAIPWLLFLYINVVWVQCVCPQLP